MSEEKVKIIVENNQHSNRQFPGWKKKYPELFNIPGLSRKESAVVAEVEKPDFQTIQREFMQNGVVVKDFESLDDDSKGFFMTAFSWLFGSDKKEAEKEDPEKDSPEKGEKAALRKQWEDIFKKLDKEGKAGFKGFSPKKATVEDLKTAIAEAEAMIEKTEAETNSK